MRKSGLVLTAICLAMAGWGCQALENRFDSTEPDASRVGGSSGAGSGGAGSGGFGGGAGFDGFAGTGGLGDLIGGTGGGPSPGADATLLGLHKASETPPPIQGGTLEVIAGGRIAVAADPARHRISFVDLEAMEARHVELEAGDRPGRIVEDDAGRLHVVLRGTGELATFDPDEASLTARRWVCAELQGVAFHAAEQALLASCASGELVTLPAAGGAPERRDFVDEDLRDVWVQDGRIQVSRFKSAEVLTLDTDRSVTARTAPSMVHVNDLGEPRSMEATTAWRVSAAPDAAYMIHQSAQIEPIELGEGGAGGSAGSGSVPGSGSSPYGGNGCGIVTSVLDRIGADGEMERGHVAGLSSAMAVDVAVSPDGQFLAFASPGTSISGSGAMSVGGVSAVLARTDVVFGDAGSVAGECNALPFSPGVGFIQTNQQVTSVAFDADGRLLLQSREPAMLQVVEDPAEVADALLFSETGPTLSLSEHSVRDTGHDLFHMVTPAGVACASCHPGGAEDGHVWSFDPIGPRRSQALHVGLAGTAPFHWDGDQDSVTALMNEVFVRRMGGPQVSDAQAKLLEEWIFELQPPQPPRAMDEPAVQRGEALFESDETQCASCHEPPSFTNNQSADVGTGGAFQVPSLVGVAYRAPLMHDGCAEDLHARFDDPECGGGDRHGKTSHLTDSQIDDLVAYLEAL